MMDLPRPQCPLRGFESDGARSSVLVDFSEILRITATVAAIADNVSATEKHQLQAKTAILTTEKSYLYSY